MITPDGIDYYPYILVYVDDIHIIDKNPEQFMDLLKNRYTIKPSSIGKQKYIWEQKLIKYITLTIHMPGRWAQDLT